MEQSTDSIEPLVSIVTLSSFDPEGFYKTVTSVKEQSYKNWELIAVVDERSEANVNVATQMKNEISKIKIFFDQGFGIYPAMNLGIDKSSGMFIIFMNSSDYFAYPDSLTVLVEAIKSGNCDLVIGGFHVQGNTVCGRVFKEKIVGLRSFAFNRSWGCHQSMLFRKNENVYYETKYRFASDFDLVLKLLKIGKVKRIPNDSNLKTLINEKKEIRRVHLKGTLNQSLNWLWTFGALMNLQMKNLVK
mgnify:CR=1 FL=1